jgi:NADP-dependent 3-hydroxy acid dehydrogenase YdfG
MTGDRDQDRFVKVIRGRGGNLPRISTVVLQFRATQKGPATGCAARRVSELRRRQGLHDRRRPSCFSCVVEPGGLATELGSHNKPEVRNEMIDPFYEQTEVLAPEDIADGVAYMVTRPRHTAIGELWIMPTDQV